MSDSGVTNGVGSGDKTSSSWSLQPSLWAKSTHNAIRAVVGKLKWPEDCELQKLSLCLGDPTVYGHLLPPETLVNAIKNNVESNKFNGYSGSEGREDARVAVAQFVNRGLTLDGVGGRRHVKPSDIVICSGCSGALEIAIKALMSPGDNILVPCPGFPLYECIANHYQGKARYYNLLPEQNWEIDLAQLDSLIDEKTRAIVINNPSNP